MSSTDPPRSSLIYLHFISPVMAFLSADNHGHQLFYILIGLLAAFGIVSFLSLMRARRRRRMILREVSVDGVLDVRRSVSLAPAILWGIRLANAICGTLTDIDTFQAERLGVMVPGVPGYIPIRERRTMNWTRFDGTEAPAWWEVENGEKAHGEESIQQARRDDRFMPGEHAFQPLAIIPPPEDRVIEPIELSPLPYFPNHLAYRESAYRPPPSKYQLGNPETLNSLRGAHLDIVTIIRMPFDGPNGRPPAAGPSSRPAAGNMMHHHHHHDDEDDPEAVFREWAGIELGIEKVDVDRR
ncbi:hypothetical protein BD324DRAFT_490463 [Kockovaella imperatae]|uniref:Uncharacterized protein n=1 Tax=Kockovaella imperatae TaxID=4999 RepID=A0A1Y1UE68_9TREE|nr:hypothetical protein BD324DRAFT_490463 [Kockovaella imperatae]ORX36351.1 hypothetical protein BD324DRAFT_490463 [Kockovaella imperatae]